MQELRNKNGFHLTRTLLGGLETVQMTHKNHDTWFSMIPGYGCCLNEFVVSGKPVLWAAHTEEGIHATLTDGNGRSIAVTTKGYRYLQVYIPPQRNNIALEPQTCAPNALNDSLECMLLRPDETLKLCMQIKVNDANST